MKRNVVLFTLLLGSALAQSAGPISLNLVMSLVKNVTVEGKVTEQIVPGPKSVFPGDVISQTVTVRNTSGKSIQNVPVKLPVPRSTIYLSPEKGMNVMSAEYSIDGGQTFAPAPLRKMVTVVENGKSVRKEVEVKPGEYTAVRWVIGELAAGQSLKLGYRVQVK